MNENNEQLDTLIQLNLLKENYNLLLEEEKFNLKEWFKDKLNSFIALAKSIPDKIRDMINKCKKNNKDLENKNIEPKDLEIKPGKKIKVTASNIKNVIQSIMRGIAETGKDIANIIQSAIKICKYAITKKSFEELKSEKRKLSDTVKRLKERFSHLNIFKKAINAINNKKSKKEIEDNKNAEIKINEEKYHITKKFYDSVNEGKVRSVRIMMQNSMTVDPSMEQFNKMTEIAKSMKGLYDTHNGENFETNKTNWNKSYMDKQMVKLIYNFSHERIAHLKNVVQYIYNK